MLVFTFCFTVTLNITIVLVMCSFYNLLILQFCIRTGYISPRSFTFLKDPMNLHSECVEIIAKAFVCPYVLETEENKRNSGRKRKANEK